MSARHRPYRRLFATPFSVEGGAMYWELLLWDRGFAHGSAQEQIGMLFWRMHRCVRVVFSLGFHLGRASVAECVDMLVQRVGHERATAEGEVRRSVSGDYTPLYQAAYLLGALQLYRLRGEVVSGCGGGGGAVDGDGKVVGMEEKEFHDRVLRENHIPIEFLRALVKGLALSRDYEAGWKFYDKVPRGVSGLIKLILKNVVWINFVALDAQCMMDGFDEETFKKFFPSGFGKQDKTTNVEAQIDRTKRVDAEPKRQQPAKLGDKLAEETGDDEDATDRRSKQELNDRVDSDSDSDADSDDSDDSDEDEDEFPTSHDLVFKTHDRAVTTITVDPSGSRMITGSTDCTIKLHDFASMTPSTLRAFKSIEPSAKKQSAASEIHPVHVARFNPLYPSQVLVISATPQAKILSRDGDTITEFVKGDMYLRDMRNTKGHISEITSGAWSPTDYNLCVTAGTDSTLRIWDVNAGRSQKEVIVHQSRAAGSAGRTRMTAVAWGSPAQGGNNLLVAAALDGSLVMWGGDGPFLRPSAQVQGAHTKDTWTSGLDISPDGRLVVTKGADDTIKLWDTRKFKSPITTVPHSSGSKFFPTSNIQFSPSGANIITGSETGDLHILNPATLKPELSTPVTPGSPLITVLWHEKLNQIVTGSANGETHVLYNPSMSHNGAVLVMSKAPKRRHIDDDPNFTTDLSLGLAADSNTGQLATSTSFASRHPTIGLTASGRSRDPRRPHLPMKTPFAKSQPDEKHIKANIPLSSMRDEDPREALFKYAEQAEKNPIFTSVWKETQPKPIFAELSEEEDEGAEPDRKKMKR
ncbi:hypothetical protein FQN51_003608 [Onygenales sp. PD_10]|nr:hypothetical protein FQN51_003608 [Onygenales sp. PD_10]